MVILKDAIIIHYKQFAYFNNELATWIACQHNIRSQYYN